MTKPISATTPIFARRDFGLHILRMGRHWRHAVDTQLRDYGLTAATWRPLFHLGNLGDGVRLKDLAEALDMERPSLGQLVDRLEREGLVLRRDAVEDRRGKTIHLTDAGREIYNQTVKVATEVADCLTADVSDEEMAQCARVFNKINAAFQQRGIGKAAGSSDRS